MVSSLYAPSRRRRNALWRQFQRPLQREIMLVAAALHPAEPAGNEAPPQTIHPEPRASSIPHTESHS
jgi:hypothetical protein